MLFSPLKAELGIKNPNGEGILGSICGSLQRRHVFTDALPYDQQLGNQLRSPIRWHNIPSEITTP